MSLYHWIETVILPQTLTVPVFGDIPLGKIFVGVTALFVLMALFRIVQGVIVARLERLSKKTTTDVDDLVIKLVRSVRVWVYTIAIIYGLIQFIALPSWLSTGTTLIFLTAIVWQAIELVTIVISYSTRRFIEKDEDGDGEIDPNAATASSMVTLFSKIALWAVGGLFVLSNLGIEVTSLIAGLGIGGIAIAFALQNILSDLFSSFSIYFDKPFRVGDFIVIGSDMGTVEKIGIKTTRLKTLQGEELVVSNTELTSARVQNFKKMQERRIVFTFGIAYETPKELVARVPKMVADVVKDISVVRLDRAHFTTYGDSALIFEVVYFVASADYNEYLDAHQQINLSLMDVFESAGITFAYPTQTLYVHTVK